MLDFPKCEENKTHSYTAGALQVKMCYFTLKNPKNLFGFLKSVTQKNQDFETKGRTSFLKVGVCCENAPRKNDFS